MKVIKKYNQHRRDCYVDLECENCGHKELETTGYDDRNFWDNVVPDFHCRECGKSSNEMGIEPVEVGTKYHQDEIV